MLILAIILFLILPIMSIPVLLIAFIKDSKYRKIYGFLLAISLAIISFKIDVKEIALDLKVYYGQMTMLKFINFSEMFEILISQKEPITNLMFFFIAKIGIYPIWQFITTFINYFIIFFILSDYAKTKNIGNKTFTIVLIFAIVFMNNIFLFTGIRNTFALMIYLCILYNEYIKQKKGIIYKILYIVPVLIHMSMIIGIIIRILMSAKKHKNLIVIGLIIYAVSPNLIVQISSLIGELPVFSDLVAKLQVYLFDARVINFNSLLHMVLLIYFIVVYYALVKKRKQENLEITNLYKALEIILLFNICSFTLASLLSMYVSMSLL